MHKGLFFIDLNATAAWVNWIHPHEPWTKATQKTALKLFGRLWQHLTSVPQDLHLAVSKRSAVWHGIRPRWQNHNKENKPLSPPSLQGGPKTRSSSGQLGSTPGTPRCEAPVMITNPLRPIDPYLSVTVEVLHHTHNLQLSTISSAHFQTSIFHGFSASGVIHASV